MKNSYKKLQWTPGKLQKNLKTCTVFQDQPALLTEILTLGRKRL